MQILPWMREVLFVWNIKCKGICIYISLDLPLSIYLSIYLYTVSAISLYSPHMNMLECWSNLVFLEILTLIDDFLSKVGSLHQSCMQNVCGTHWARLYTLTTSPPGSKKDWVTPLIGLQIHSLLRQLWNPSIFSLFLKIFDLARFLGSHILLDGKFDSPEKYVLIANQRHFHGVCNWLQPWRLIMSPPYPLGAMLLDAWQHPWLLLTRCQ